jgi:hypothetical protein
MEIPYHGRAIINEYFDGMEIAIPVKRNWLLVAFLPIWLGGWSFGFFFAVTMLFSSAAGGADLFVFFWLCIWTAGGFFAAATWWWNVAGKEIITVSQGVLTIVKKGSIAKTKSYDLNEAQNYRAEEDFSDDFAFGRRRRRGLTLPWNVPSEGTVRFDYGMETVRFGDKLHKPEGEYILERLRSKRLIK